MRIFRHFDALPREARGAAVAIGNFDGVHRGHRAVIGEAGQIAHAQNLPWAVLTFEPHPRNVFQPDVEPFRITPFRAKARAIADLGVDHLIVLRFDRHFAGRPADAFVIDILAEGLGARHVIAGYDFVFGKGRGGNCELLLRMGKTLGFDFTAVSAVADASGEVLSSTRIRKSLADGDPKTAASILGRPFEIEGRVRHGQARGRTIGFPTANIAMGRYLTPALGVYAVKAAIEAADGDMAWHKGVANLGRRPTFDGEGVVLEVFLFDFSGDLYGKRMRVQLIDYLRPEMKFDGIERLKAQIGDDSAKARRVLAETGGRGR